MKNIRVQRKYIAVGPINNAFSSRMSRNPLMVGIGVGVGVGVQKCICSVSFSIISFLRGFYKPALVLGVVCRMHSKAIASGLFEVRKNEKKT